MPTKHNSQFSTFASICQHLIRFDMMPLCHKLSIVSNFDIERNQNWIIAIECGDPTTKLINLNQQYKSGASSNTPFTEGAFLYIVCKPGYNWTDGVQIKTMNCNESQIWIYHPTCIGIFLPNFWHYMFLRKKNVFHIFPSNFWKIWLIISRRDFMSKDSSLNFFLNLKVQFDNSAK